MLSVAACSRGPDCSDVTGLTPAESNAREDTEYFSPGPEPGRSCAVCASYVAPASEKACAHARS